ncbi:MAG: tetratricopeptide repeat protein [Methanobrevibacter sp.]
MSNIKNLDEKFLNACSLYENHDFDGAMEIFNELLLADYDVDTILPYLIKFYLKNNDTDKVLEYLNTYLDDNSSLYELLVLKASILLKKYKANESLEIANKILEKDSLNDSAIMIKLASLKLLGQVNEIKSFQREIGLDLISDEELSHFDDNSTTNNQDFNKIRKTDNLNFITADSLIHDENKVTSKNTKVDQFDVGDLKHEFGDKDLGFVTANNLNSDKIKDNLDFKNNKLAEKEDSNYNNIINDFVSSMDNNIYDVDGFNGDNPYYDENQEEYTDSDISIMTNVENLNEDINKNKVDVDIQEDGSINNNLIDDYFNENDSEELTTFEIGDIDIPIVTEDYSKDFSKNEDIDIPIIAEDYSKDFTKNTIDIDSLFDFDENGNLIEDIPNRNGEHADYSLDVEDSDSNSSNDYIDKFDSSSDVYDKSKSNSSCHDLNEFGDVYGESGFNDLDSSNVGFNRFNSDKNSNESDDNKSNSTKDNDSSKGNKLDYHNRHFNHSIKMHNFRESTLDSFFNFS